MTLHGFVLCDDLIFFSRVAGAARAAGLTVRQVRTMGELLEAAQRNPPGGVILDLHNPGLELPKLLLELQTTCPSMPHVVAYGSHVEAEVLQAARNAGCDRVLARSKFVKDLEHDVAAWLGQEAESKPGAD